MLVLTICFTCFSAKAGMLLDFDNGTGHDLTGWVWSDNVNGYGAQGWRMVDDPTLGKGQNFYWGDGPRSLNKMDYGAADNAIIDDSERAPSTESGGSFKVYSTPGSTDNQSSWWVWYDGRPLIDRGIADANTNRMSFYLKIEGMQPIKKDGGADSINTDFHIGTYLCWNGSGPAYGSGDGCPFEGPGNQHYYHYLAVDPGAWVHVLLNEHPQHLRGVSATPKNNPVSSFGKSYFAQLNQMYMEIRYSQPNPTSMNIDQIKLYSTKDTAEPAQNEDSITSLWVGYWGSVDEWRIGFSDESFDTYNDYSWSTFEIRWSLSPITNSNYSSANIVQPELYSGATYVDKADPHAFRRATSWGPNAFTTFKLPADKIRGARKIYFAIKDISAKNQHAGSGWPWNKGDGHDAPTSNITTIDYALSAPSPPKIQPH